jgi:ABC-type multidrug transport system ATPase subunit
MADSVDPESLQKIKMRKMASRGSNPALELLSSNQAKNSQLTFKDVKYSVEERVEFTGNVQDFVSRSIAKKPIKTILHGITGSVNSGEVLAIMGPSGAGKTCLIDLLTLESKNGDSVGEVRLNGETMNKDIFTKFCATVPQQDKHWAFLTCRETVAFAADLYLDIPKEEKTARVDAVLATMGLTGCADTKVGNAFFSGLSGGQKRRLSLAIALLSNPLVLFLDEPTSGLDAAAAASIMKFLKDLAVAANIAIVCTIHQPSSAVYNGFDRVMLLSKGRIAFLGAAAEALPYFREIGHQMPPNTNPAEFMLDLVNAEFTDPESVDEVLAEWAKKEANSDVDATRREPVVGLPTDYVHCTNCARQVATLVRRHGKLTIRDPTLYIGRMVMFINACVFFSIIYIKARDRKQTQVLARLWLTLWHIGVPASLGVVAVHTYNEEYYAIKREVKNGMLSPVSYLLANFVIQVPLIILMAMCALSISLYGIANYYGDNYFQFMLVYAINLWVYERVAQLLSVSFANPLLGMLVFLQVWFASFLFNGVLVAEDDVVWPFRVGFSILPLKWCFRSLLYLEYSDTTFSGAEIDASDSRGFTCGADNILQCYGRTGKQVLDSLGDNYQSISSANNVGKDVGIMLAIGAVFMLMHIYLLTKKTKAVKLVKSPQP